MEITQKLDVLFWLNRSKVKPGQKAPIYVRLTINGDYCETSLGVKISSENWDVKSKLVTEDEVGYKAANLKILNAQTRLDKLFIVLCSQYEVVTPQMIKNVYLGKPAIEKPKEDVHTESQTIIKAFDQFITKFEKKAKKGKRSNETLKHWRTTRTKILDFLLHHFKLTDIDVKKITPVWADEIYDFLTLECTPSLSEVTAKKHIKSTRQILKECVKKTWINRNPFEDFNCSGGQKDVLPLEFEQVFAIYKKTFSIERLDEVKDCYIFQCFTGFAFQDLYNLTPENIVLINGERWLIKDRGKTGVSETVPILPVIENLIKKYSHHPCRIIKNKLMPVNSNNRYNGYLKEIAAICGIARELNTHLARHTFADIMLNLGVPLEDVSKMLGHKNIRTTQRYCRVRPVRIQKSMKLIEKVLFTKIGELKKIAV